MKKTKCPNCQADINRFMPERIDLTKKVPWYKPMRPDSRMICSSCRKCLVYKRTDARLLLLMWFLIADRAAEKEPFFGYPVFWAITFYVFYTLIMHMFSNSIYEVAKKQLEPDIKAK